MDLTAKKPVTVRITGDSQMKALPPFVAQRIALRLRSRQAGAGADSGPAPEAAPTPPSENAPRGPRAGGQGDVQQMLNRMPPVSLGELQKGGAVMMVTTAGSAGSDPAVIILLTGVEPILTNGRSAAVLLSPWNVESSLSDAMGP